MINAGTSKLNIAHRGASAYEPENTIRAINRALEIGADAVEVDVRQSKDGILVVMHDEKVDRTTNGTGYVGKMTLGELKRLDAGKGEKIPTLSEVLDVVNRKAKLILELKLPGIEEKLLNVIREYKIEDMVAVDSFFHPAIRKIKELEPRIKAGIDLGCMPVNPERVALDAKADAIYVHFGLVLWYPRLVDTVKKAGLETIAWTVDDEATMRELLRTEIVGIMTNKPDLLKKCKKEMST